MRAGFLLGLGLAAVAGPAFAGAWTFEQGRGQVIVTALHSDSAKGFDDDGRMRDIPDYRKSTVDMLVEYGLTDRTTVMFKPMYRDVDIQGSGDSSGAGLTEIGVRHRFSGTDGWIVSGQASYLVAGNGGDGARVAQAGADHPEADARLLLGHAFKVGERDGFVDLQAGYHWRSDDPPDEWRADLTVGVRPQPRLLLMAQLFNVWSEGEGRNGFPGYRYHNLQASVAYDVSEDWTIQAGVVGTVDGENALRERGVLLSVWRRF